MSAFLRWLTNRYVLFFLGVLLATALILTLGAWLDWSAVLQLGLVAGLLLICAVVLLVSVLRAGRHAHEIEQTIRTQADHQANTAAPERQAEVERLQRKLVSAIETLKTSKLGQGRGGRTALYALPWYMVVGPPAAGKTSAIMNSGLQFPLGLDRVRGVGGTRDCDWFFTDQAILIDTAGRYMTEPEDEGEWLAFLDVLRKHRRRQPINGVLVGFSLADLAEMPPEEVERHAAAMRARIDELVRRLKTRFPVYLLFTKADLLQGFVEFFDGLPPDEREQVWGATLRPEALEEGGVVEAFEEEYDRLADALVERRPHSLGYAETAEDRRGAYLFPLEFGAMKPALSGFVRELLQPNPYQESPDFRGFYFTSGTQEGAPIDQVTQAIADAFELPADQPHGFDPEMETQSYFIKRLFTDVVVPDQYRARSTGAATRRQRALRAAAAVTAVVGLGLFALGAGQATLRSQATIARTSDAAEAVQPIRWTDADATSYARMANLRDEIAALDRYETERPALSWGLYRGDRLRAPAHALYEQKARGFVEAEPFAALLARMRGAARPSPVQAASSTGRRASAPAERSRAARDSLYADLRALILLTTEHERAGNEGNPAFLKRYLGAVARRTLPPPAFADSAAAPVQTMIDAYVDGLVAGRLDPMPSNPTLVEEVRAAIYEPPSIERAYARIKEEAEVLLPPLTLSDALQGRSTHLFASQPSVPGFFTLRGWETYARDAIASEAEQPNRLDWVMGYATEDLPSSMRDPDAFAEALEALYFDEYTNAWTRFLRSVSARAGGDVGSAARALAQLGDAYESPLLYVLAQATIQTRFDPTTLDQVRERAARAAGNVAERQARRRLGRVGRDLDLEAPEAEAEMHPVSARFQWLHRLDADKAQSGGASPALMGALGALAQAAAELDGFASDDARAAAYAAQVLERGGGPLNAHLGEVSSALAGFDRQVRDGLFARPLMGAWASVAGAARRYLDARWRDDVIRPYQATLAGRFPLDFSSRQAAPLNEFAAFFRPADGALARFRDEVLAPFLERGQARTWQGVGVGVGPAAQRAFADAERIRDGLFNGGVVELGFELQPELPDREPDAPFVGQIYANIHGQSASYGMGNTRPWTDFVWPGRPDALLRVSTRDGELDPLAYSGDWAWARMFDAAEVRRRSATEYDVRWPVGQGITVRYNLRAQRAQNPFADPRAFFRFQPPSSLSSSAPSESGGAS